MLDMRRSAIKRHEVCAPRDQMRVQTEGGILAPENPSHEINLPCGHFATCEKEPDGMYSRVRKRVNVECVWAVNVKQEGREICLKL